MTTCLLCSNILQRYPHFLPAFLPSVLPSCIFRLCFLSVMQLVSWQEALCEEETGGLDPKDPNRPRFTLQELRDVLHERNELKAKVFLLQEELAYYKRYSGGFQSEETSHGRITTPKLILTLCFCSEEAEDEIVTPSPSPSPELRTRARSSAQPESGIKRLYVALQIHSPAHENTRLFKPLGLPPSLKAPLCMR